MPKAPDTTLDLNKLAAIALDCSHHWRAWAKAHVLECTQAARAHRMATLFEEQATILSELYRNRAEAHEPMGRMPAGKKKAWSHIDEYARHKTGQGQTRCL